MRRSETRLASAASPSCEWARRGGRRIVTLGGGHGQSALLPGLQQVASDITAIVTVSDDGGSSGRLVREFSMTPPGDVRNALVALAEADPELTGLFQHRFPDVDGRELGGHTLGNLVLTALWQRNHGDFAGAVRQAAELLGVRGAVLPAAACPVRLRAQMADGSVLTGETRIVASPMAIERISLCRLDGSVSGIEPLPEAIAAIQQADIIVVGPGSLFTSVIPALLVPGIAEALRETSARVFYVCNAMTQPGETDGFSAGDHVLAIVQHIGLPFADYALLQDWRDAIVGSLDDSRVQVDPDRIRRTGIHPLLGNFVRADNPFWHESSVVARTILNVFGRDRYGRVIHHDNDALRLRRQVATPPQHLDSVGGKAMNLKKRFQHGAKTIRQLLGGGKADSIWEVMLRTLLLAVEEKKQTIAGRTVVPRLYTLYLATEDFEAICQDGLRAEFEPALKAALHEHVTRQGYQVPHSIVVTLEGAKEFACGEAGYAASFQAPESEKDTVCAPRHGRDTTVQVPRSGPSTSRPDAWLERMDGPMAGKLFPLTPAAAIIGRLVPGNPLPIGIDDDTHSISKRHARIGLDEVTRLFYLCDEDSTNGTTLNGERLIPRVPCLLQNGDIVVLGGSVTLRMHDTRTLLRSSKRAGGTENATTKIKTGVPEDGSTYVRHSPRQVEKPSAER